MIKSIIQDYLLGVTQSVRLDLFIAVTMQDIKFRETIGKIIRLNTYLYFMPYLFVTMIDKYFEVQMLYTLSYLSYIVTIIGTFIHLVYYTDAINAIRRQKEMPTYKSGLLDTTTLIITMSLYQFAIYLTTTIIDVLLYQTYYLAKMINFVILSIYHSLYCYNNLWHCRGIKIAHRIDMHEKLWPMYIGYGAFVTLLYFCTFDHYYITGLYNIYMAVIVSLPFILNVKYPPQHTQYPSINLGIFTYIIKRIFNFVKFIIG